MKLSFMMLTNSEKQLIFECNSNEDLYMIRQRILKNRNNPDDIKVELDTIIHNLVYKPIPLPKPTPRIRGFLK